MIHSLRGALAAVEANFIVVECAGVGYGVRTTMHTIGKLPALGEEVRVCTHLSVREDAVELFGFLEPRELECFRLLTAVTGVGPKAAIAILSELTPDKLSFAVLAGDAKAITRAPGVGPKLAGRIVMELKDKLGGGDFLPQEGGEALPMPGASSDEGEAVSALVALGYSPSEAAASVAKQGAGKSVQDLIKGALKHLAGGR